jgi:hypothetical protein
MMQVFTFSGLLTSSEPLRTLRVCHWDPSMTNLPPGVTLKVRFEVRAAGLESVDVKVHDLYQATGNPGVFNPSGPLRNLDRDVGRVSDSDLIVDASTVPDLNQGVVLWQEAGAVQKIVSPTYEMSRDDDRELTLSVARMGLTDVAYAVNIFVDF